MATASARARFTGCWLPSRWLKLSLSHGSVGFLADGRVAVALTGGLGSIVTYGNGTTDIGAWHEGVPPAG